MISPFQDDRRPRDPFKEFSVHGCITYSCFSTLKNVKVRHASTLKMAMSIILA
jgi:hypothetical protein